MKAKCELCRSEAILQNRNETHFGEVVVKDVGKNHFGRIAEEVEGRSPSPRLSGGASTGRQTRTNTKTQIRNTNTQTHKYTNTVCSNLQIDPTSAIFFHRKLYQDIKNNIPKCLTCKYTIQIHKYTNTI